MQKAFITHINFFSNEEAVDRLFLLLLCLTPTTPEDEAHKNFNLSCQEITRQIISQKSLVFKEPIKGKNDCVGYYILKILSIVSYSVRFNARCITWLGDVGSCFVLVYSPRLT